MSLKNQRADIITYMDSDHFIFSDTVKFNITLDKNQGNLEDAINLAELNNDINSFEEKLDTRLMERGLRVSGGQRQRISLARAWFANTQILILDDPFSAIDINMEEKIINNLKNNLDDKVILLFSHRLLAFKHTNQVIVLDDGRITQIGTHESLIKDKGLYKDIYEAQQYFEGDEHEE